MSNEKLVSEAVVPVFEEPGYASAVTVGAPVLPGAFRWRGADYPVLRVLESGRDLGLCTHGSGERYVRRHWYRFETTGGAVFRVYFERRPRTGGAGTQRWWLYSRLGSDHA